MKLLKYVMTTDCGLAPNPFFGVCSLALCTPNHMNAKLEVGDWVVGHSSRKRGNRLIYAMRLTKILDMPSYFAAFPEKRPNPTGSLMEQCGDNLYDCQGGQWTRLPSACHNNVAIFKQDSGERGQRNFSFENDSGPAHDLPARCCGRPAKTGKNAGVVFVPTGNVSGPFGPVRQAGGSVCSFPHATHVTPEAGHPALNHSVRASARKPSRYTVEHEHDHCRNLHPDQSKGSE